MPAPLLPGQAGEAQRARPREVRAGAAGLLSTGGPDSRMRGAHLARLRVGSTARRRVRARACGVLGVCGERVQRVPAIQTTGASSAFRRKGSRNVQTLPFLSFFLFSRGSAASITACQRPEFLASRAPWILGPLGGCGG
jgi:hypothetical protein